MSLPRPRTLAETANTEEKKRQRDLNDFMNIKSYCISNYCTSQSKRKNSLSHFQPQSRILQNIPSHAFMTKTKDPLTYERSLACITSADRQIQQAMVRGLGWKYLQTRITGKATRARPTCQFNNELKYMRCLGCTFKLYKAF